jgi:shikimate dehydrogenase
VVGDPISHSRSPVIQEAALVAAGVPGTYEAIRADEAGFAEVIGRIRRGDLDGCNVTMPHKALAAASVDRLTPAAARSGSVNTIVREGSALVGHTTDVSGLARLWTERRIPSDGPVLVLGTGGAAAAACLAVEGTTVYLAGRRPEAVGALATRLGGDLVPLPWGTAVAQAVVVNATPLGMAGEELPERIVSLSSAVCDLAYGEAVTPAVAHATASGKPVIDGLDLLVAQAADSFRLWTGRAASVEAMKRALEKDSSGQSEAPNDS